MTRLRLPSWRRRYFLTGQGEGGGGSLGAGFVPEGDSLAAFGAGTGSGTAFIGMPAQTLSRLENHTVFGSEQARW